MGFSRRFFSSFTALAPCMRSAARLAVRLVDRALLMVVNVTAPTREPTHRGPRISDADARRMIRDWERRTRTDDVCTAEAWCDPWQRVRGS